MGVLSKKAGRCVRRRGNVTGRYEDMCAGGEGHEWLGEGRPGAGYTRRVEMQELWASVGRELLEGRIAASRIQLVMR